MHQSSILHQAKALSSRAGTQHVAALVNQHSGTGDYVNHLSRNGLKNIGIGTLLCWFKKPKQETSDLRQGINKVNKSTAVIRLGSAAHANPSVRLRFRQNSAAIYRALKLFA
jgi:hypothetical protein